MTMFNPPHPGSILKEDVLPELGIGVTEAAAQLGVSRVALSRVVNVAWRRIQPHDQIVIKLLREDPCYTG
ncbi:MAG: helix-turn-helix transcriptional regulator [Methylobacter sp.]|jgi:addiction module HigA family antidote